MNSHLATLVEAAKLGREELAKFRESAPAAPAQAEAAIRRLTDVLQSEAVSDALVALEQVEDAPSMKSDPPVDLRVPYPWRSHRRSRMTLPRN
ncbi:MAG: hypothetical protein AB7V13_25685 [Pseudorhodoplanes sp.]|uniref:hypothetical protein n=1 Tax=Pseudorhodoplanes sp. TaxID=1934341 RepID=UPI003D138BC2